VEFIIEAFSLAGRIDFSPKCPFVYLLHERMASRSDRSFSPRKLKRYMDFTESHFRMARFLAERTGSKKLAGVARNFLMPKAYIKQFTIYAWQADEISFKKHAASPEVRRALWSSVKYITKKPEVFLKSLWILTAPRSYYKYRLNGRN